MRWLGGSPAAPLPACTAPAVGQAGGGARVYMTGRLHRPQMRLPVPPCALEARGGCGKGRGGELPLHPSRRPRCGREADSAGGAAAERPEGRPKPPSPPPTHSKLCATAAAPPPPQGMRYSNKYYGANKVHVNSTGSVWETNESLFVYLLRPYLQLCQIRCTPGIPAPSVCYTHTVGSLAFTQLSRNFHLLHNVTVFPSVILYRGTMLG